jgi:hypothetical protein
MVHRLSNINTVNYTQNRTLSFLMEFLLSRVDSGIKCTQQLNSTAAFLSRSTVVKCLCVMINIDEDVKKRTRARCD